MNLFSWNTQRCSVGSSLNLWKDNIMVSLYLYAFNSYSKKQYLFSFIFMPVWYLHIISRSHFIGWLHCLLDSMARKQAASNNFKKELSQVCVTYVIADFDMTFTGLLGKASKIPLDSTKYCALVSSFMSYLYKIPKWAFKS